MEILARKHKNIRFIWDFELHEFELSGVYCILFTHYMNNDRPSRSTIGPIPSSTETQGSKKETISSSVHSRIKFASSYSTEIYQ